MFNPFKKLFGKEKKTGEAGKKEPAKLSAASEAALLSIMEKTGWDREVALKKIREAKKKAGITYKDYDKLNMHTVPVDQIKGEYQKYQNRKELRKELREKCIADIVEKRGCGRKEAARDLDSARKRLGVTYGEYLNNGFGGLSEQEQDDLYARLQEEKEEREKEKSEELRQRRRKIVNEVMERTGWDRPTARAKIREARARTGCNYEEYLIYKFYEMDEKTQDEIFVMSFSKKLKAKYTPDRNFSMMLCDKAATNTFFDDCLRRPWCMNNKVTFEEFCEKFRNCRKIIYKPLSGNWGRGVVGFEIQDNLQEIYDEVITFPEGVIEQFVVQHPKMSELSPTAVNTVRVVTFSSNTGCVTKDGKKMDVAYASLKIGGVTSNIVDNLHGGGMVAGIDLQTGKLITDGADNQGNTYAIHPVTGMQIKGFEVPYFKEAIEMVTRAIKEKKLHGYLGWDVAIGENGPELIEVNLMPGVILLTMPYIAEKKGMKPLMEKYL